MLTNDCALKILYKLIKTNNKNLFVNYFSFYFLYQHKLTNNGMKKATFFHLLKKWEINYFFSSKITNNNQFHYFLFIKLKDQLHLIKILKIFKNFVIFYDPFFKVSFTSIKKLSSIAMAPILVIPKKTKERHYYFLESFKSTSKSGLKYLFLDLFLIFNYLSFAVVFHVFFLSSYEITNLCFYFLLSFLIYFSKFYCERKILKLEFLSKSKFQKNIFSLIKVLFLFLLLFATSFYLFCFFLLLFTISILIFLSYKYFLIFNFRFEKVNQINLEKNQFIFGSLFVFILSSILFHNFLLHNKVEIFFLFCVSYVTYFFYLEINKIINYFIYFE
ncbi:hypothetical protein JTY60_02175 [symbiont of Argiope bruennichi]|uniref:hypothetical protein n=1 Tax=symbiont of Argiope bruennichi TaxID=2810479 RepID=UPI003DA32512